MMRYIKSLPGMISLVGILVLVLVALIPTLQLAATVNDIMRVLISLVVLAAALYVILSDKYDDDVKKWAFGVVGLIVGYWLPTTTS